MENPQVAYLEPSWISAMELFSENSWRLLGVNYFRKNSIVVVRVGSKYVSGLYCILLYKSKTILLCTVVKEKVKSHRNMVHPRSL